MYSNIFFQLSMCKNNKIFPTYLSLRKYWNNSLIILFHQNKTQRQQCFFAKRIYYRSETPKRVTHTKKTEHIFISAVTLVKTHDMRV